MEILSMKKKSPRGIPDFAPKKPHGMPLVKFGKEKPVKPPVQQPINIKPPATSAKSGRRGS
jgi:hypothetical protein